MDSINWNDWSKDIEEAIQHRDEITQAESPELIWNYMEELINKSNSKHGKIKKSTIHSKPYWTPKLTELLKTMRTTRRTYNKRNTDNNKHAMSIAKEQFDNERKKVCEDFILEKTK